jgi:catechol 2,3-dioxygenase-like lactoylglutathione lyase family enzyme
VSVAALLAAVLTVRVIERHGGQPLVPVRAKFHHIHLAQGNPDAFADYYHRLFVPDRTQRGTFLGHPGIRDATSMLLFASGQNRRQDDDSVAWQMGWGAVRLDQSYRQHYLQEVNWKTPYESLSKQLHLHVRCSDVKGTAAWFQDVLDADVELSRVSLASENSEVRGVVRFDGLTLALHQTRGTIASSRDAGVIDHLAFSVRSLDAVDVPLTVQERGALYAPAGRRSGLVTGPDGLLIELIEDIR